MGELSTDFRDSIRLERREYVRASDQRRQIQRGDVVRFAACGCQDGLHDAPDHMDYCRDLESALEDGEAMGRGNWHVVRVEKARVDA